MRMKKVLMMACALLMGASAVNAQNTELPKDGDLFQGLTRSITYDRPTLTWVRQTSWLARLTVRRMSSV